MKLKCNILSCLLFALVFVFTITSTQAQHHHNHKHPHAKKKVVQHRKAKAAAARSVHKSNMAHSYKVIKRTNLVIVKANRVVKKNKVYTGDLSRAVHHQRHAKRLLKQHKAHRAMQHSRLARNYAIKAIKYNKGMINKDDHFNAEEKKLMGENIADAELEKELKGNYPNVSFKDENISDKDMTDLEVLETDPADYKNE